MPVSLETRWLKITVVCMMIINGCASYNPRQIEEVPFRERAKTQVEGNVRVTAAVPSSEESKRLFGVNTYARGGTADMAGNRKQ